MAKVLLIDDEITTVQMVTEFLRADGYEVIPCTSASAAFELLDSENPDLVLTDIYLDRTTQEIGLEILRKARSKNPPVTVVVMTAHGSELTALKAWKYGAFGYLKKPFKLEDDLKVAVEHALLLDKVSSENILLRKQVKKKYHFSQIIGSSPLMLGVFRMIERVANTDSTVLLLGESGTGKELVSRALHNNSRRQFAPFVPINCSALPENLLESELFGHRKGSFTGAINDKKGLFEEADGGTILLDEIGSMSAVLQSRLLRVLQEKEVRRVGDNTPVYVDVRVVAATNEPLEKRMKEGTFREDLYYRLNVIPINLPSLRERKEDIPLLVAHFLREKVDPRTGKAFQMTRQTMEILGAYEWPGNVRELENAIERACALCDGGTLKMRDLPPALLRHSPTAGLDADADGAETVKLPSPSEAAVTAGPGAAPAKGEGPLGPIAGVHPTGPLKNFLRDQEVAYINRVLAQTGGDKERAAEVLGVSLATLYRKLAEDGTT